MISVPPVLASLGWLTLALGSALLADDRQRRFAAAGLLSLGLGLAASRVGAAGAGVLSPDQPGNGFLAINGGLVLLGLGLVVVASVRGDRRLVAGMLVIAGAILVLSTNTEVLLAAGVPRVVGAAAVLGAVAFSVSAIGRALARAQWARAVGRLLLTEPLRPMLPAIGPVWKRVAAGAALAGAAAVVLGPHVSIAFAGMVVAAWSGFFLFHSGDRRPVPVAPTIGLGLLPAYWLLATVAGPEGLSVDALPVIPLSPAAEGIVAGALLLSAWAVAGQWPLHRQLPGALTGVLGALLLVRVALPLAPGGLEYWRPLAIPLLVVGMWHAAAWSRWPLLLVGGAFLALATRIPDSGAGAALLGSAILLELRSMGSLPASLVEVSRIAAWALGTWGGSIVLEAGLRTEVVYTACGTAGLAILIAWGKTPSTTAR